MATPASVAAAAVVKILAGTTAGVSVTPSLHNRFKVTAGNTDLRTRTVLRGQFQDSNVVYPVMEFFFEFVHHLTDPTDDATYVDGAAVSDQLVLAVASFWRTIAGVYEVEEDVAMEEPERFGNYVVWTGSIQLAVTP